MASVGSVAEYVMVSVPLELAVVVELPPTPLMLTLELSAKGHVAVSDPVAGLLAVLAEVTVTDALTEQLVGVDEVGGDEDPERCNRHAAKSLTH